MQSLRPLLALFCLASISLGSACVCNSESKSTRRSGRWHRDRSQAQMTAKQKAQAQRLESIGYLSGSESAVSTTGVVVHDKARTYPGLNLYTAGHRAEATLMTAEGKPLHRWSKPYEDVFGSDDESGFRNHGAGFWRRVYMYPNGDLLAIYGGLGMIKIDKHSKLIWKSRNKAHHDLEVLEDGSIYTLSREVSVIPDISQDTVLEDFILVLDSDGKTRKRVRMYDAWKNSDYSDFPLERAKSGDIMHTNTLEVLDGKHQARHPAFKKGNVLVSLRSTGWLAVIDMQLERIVWMIAPVYSTPKELRWRGQHQPTMLDNGNMLLFDNRVRKLGSRVIEFDPFKQELKWEYRTQPPKDFFSQTCGSAIRLPNGNTLISETDHGRAFEVTPDKETVWRFVNPHRAGENGGLIASLFEVLRVPLEDAAWLGSRLPAPKAAPSLAPLPGH